MDESASDAFLEKQKTNDFSVWPENWPAVRAFLSCATQWREVVMPCDKGMTTVKRGLRYEALESALNMWGVKRRDRAEIFEGVRVMEQAALEAWA